MDWFHLHIFASSAPCSSSRGWHQDHRMWSPAGCKKTQTRRTPSLQHLCAPVAYTASWYLQVLPFLTSQAHKSIQLKEFKAHSMQSICGDRSFMTPSRTVLWTKCQICEETAGQTECLSPKGLTSRWATLVLALQTTSPQVFLCENKKKHKD